MLEALLQGSDPSPGVMRYFRDKLMVGELTLAMVEQQRSTRVA